MLENFFCTPLIGVFGIGTPELLIVLGVLVLLFGGAKLPSLMRNMGRSVNEFKAGMADKPAKLEEGESDPAP